MKKVSLLLTVLLLSGIIHAQEVQLVNTTGTWYDGGSTKVLPGCDVTFYIDFVNNSSFDHGGFTTGFELYTPGSSGISTTVFGDTLPSGIPWIERFGLGAQVDHSGCDGTYPEILGFSGAGLPVDPGFPAGDILHVSITATAPPQGNTLCIDSSFFGAIGFWVWGEGYNPSWDGPHCFEAVIPGHLPIYMNCPDSIFITECNTVSFSDFYTDPLMQPTVGEDVKILEGPGHFEYDPFRWQWDFTELPTEPVLLVIALYDWALCYEQTLVCSTYITPYHPPIDPLFSYLPDFITLENCCHWGYGFTLNQQVNDKTIEKISGPGLLTVVDGGMTLFWEYYYTGTPQFPQTLEFGVRGEPCGIEYYDTTYSIVVNHCFEFVQSDCLQFTYQPDTLFITSPNSYSLNLIGVDECESSVEPFKFKMLGGPGTIDPVTNTWNIHPTIDDTMKVTYISIELQQSCNSNNIIIPLKYTFGTSYYAGDVNIDGRKDISDLLYLVDYFFKQPPGPAPPEPMFADCNNSGLLDISDLLMMVDYYFGTGEPCSLE